MTCKLPTCDNDSRDSGQYAFAKKFCSDMCEVKYDHLRQEAREARDPIEPEEPEHEY